MLAEVVPSDVCGCNGKDNAESIIQNHRLLESDFDENGEMHKVKLTVREKEVLGLSAQGIPIKQIAPLLDLSVRTVEKHRSNIMGKMKATNIIEAIVIAQRNHLLNVALP